MKSKVASTKVENTKETVKRKTFTGTVVSVKRNQTIGVSIMRFVSHPLYGKSLKRTHTIAAHNEDKKLEVGDTVQIVACRPISKTKHFKVIEKI